jgi:hypothetical protein
MFGMHENIDANTAALEALLERLQPVYRNVEGLLLSLGILWGTLVQPLSVVLISFIQQRFHSQPLNLATTGDKPATQQLPKMQ